MDDYKEAIRKNPKVLDIFDFLNKDINDFGEKKNKNLKLIKDLKTLENELRAGYLEIAFNELFNTKGGN